VTSQAGSGCGLDGCCCGSNNTALAQSVGVLLVDGVFVACVLPGFVFVCITVNTKYVDFSRSAAVLAHGASGKLAALIMSN